MHALIEAHGLSKMFGKVQALSDLNLELPGGKPVAILGPNGAGKTTFVRMVATLIRPDTGTLTVGAYDVVKDLDEGTLEGLDMWRVFHSEGFNPEEVHFEFNLDETPE